MITARFYSGAAGFTGFRVSGHSGYADAGADIVCAAVTSAVRLAETAVNDVLNAGAKVKINESDASVELKLGSAPQGRDILRALNIYFKALASEYPQYFQTEEVNVND